jgi:hypothetical protein
MSMDAFNAAVRTGPYLTDAEHAEIDRSNREPPEGWAAHSVRMRARRDRLAVGVLQERLHEAEMRAFWLEAFYEATVEMVRRRDRRVAELERLLDQAWRVVQTMRGSA